MKYYTTNKTILPLELVKIHLNRIEELETQLDIYEPKEMGLADYVLKFLNFPVKQNPYSQARAKLGHKKQLLLSLKQSLEIPRLPEPKNYISSNIEKALA